MALSDYQPERREFNLKGGSFAVEGVSLEKFALLLRTHLSDLEKLYALTQGVLGNKAAPDEADLERIAMILAHELPGLVASLIAMASGEHSEAAIAAARRLPAPIQIDVLLAIASLTFEEVGGIKKFISSLTMTLAQMKVTEAVKGKK